MWFAAKPAKPPKGKYPYVVLNHDAWDDFGYKTTFTAVLHVSQTKVVALGNVKILERSQTHGSTPMPREAVEALSSEYCSVGGDLSYYEKVFKLGPRICRAYLAGLRDVAYDPHIRARFEDLEGYRVSLLRFSGAEATIADAERLVADVPAPQPITKQGFAFSFKTTFGRPAGSFVVDFDFHRRSRLPHRVNVVVGYNGTGKTHLLSNLAIAASGYGYGSKEDHVSQRAGHFVGTPPPFKTVIVVSYSAFDTFVIPGGTKVEQARLKQAGAIFGYVYCGLREHAGKQQSGNAAQYRLRTPEEIDAEFVGAVRRIRTAKRTDALLAALRPLLHDTSFQRIGLTGLWEDNEPSDTSALVKLFRSLSSGHKVVLKIVVELTAHIHEKQPTLVLIDEPETHLHPPLLASFLKSIRVCLNHFDGYAILSTHSPVVLQETPSKYVRVLRRTGELSSVEEASRETFGENVGVITTDIFNLDDSRTDWHSTLRALARQYTLQEIEELFGRGLGFAAKSYVVSLRDKEREA